MRYQVLIEREESGAWLARIRNLPGCHTYGRTLDAAKRRIREALGLWIKHPERADLQFDVRLPTELRRAVAPVARARHRADEASRDAQRTLRDAVERLTDAGMSLRDIGDLLGISHQRVAQVLDEAS